MEGHQSTVFSTGVVSKFIDERNELYDSLKAYSSEELRQPELDWNDRQLELWHELTSSAKSVQAHLRDLISSTGEGDFAVETIRNRGAAMLEDIMPALEEKSVNRRPMSDLVTRWSTFLSSGRTVGTLGTKDEGADIQVVKLSLIASYRLKHLRAVLSRWETEGEMEDDLNECAMVCSALLDQLIEQKSISDSQIEDPPSGEEQPTEQEPSLPSDQSEVRGSVELEDVQPTGTRSRNRGGLYQDMPDEGWDIKSLLNKRVSNDETSYYVEWPGDYKPSWLTEDTVREAATKSGTIQKLEVLISDLESRLAVKEMVAMSSPTRATRGHIRSTCQRINSDI